MPPRVTRLPTSGSTQPHLPLTAATPRLPLGNCGIQDRSQTLICIESPEPLPSSAYRPPRCRLRLRLRLRAPKSREMRQSEDNGGGDCTFYRESLIFWVRGSHIAIAPFLKRSQQQHNTLLFLMRSVQLTHPSRVSCSDLFLPMNKFTTTNEEKGRISDKNLLPKKLYPLGSGRV